MTNTNTDAGKDAEKNDNKQVITEDKDEDKDEAFQQIFQKIQKEMLEQSEFMMAGERKERTVKAIEVRKLLTILRKKLLRNE